jgi:hypothetical protein
MKRFWHHDWIRNARLVLPSFRVLGAIGCAYILLEVAHRSTLPEYSRLLAEPTPSVYRLLQSAILCIAAWAFANYRAGAFHPYLRASYRNWLMLAGWRPGKALPLGPVTLTWSDAVLLLIAMGLVWRANFMVPPFAVLAIFAGMYLLLIAFSLLREGPRVYAYAIVFGLGGMLMFATRPELACAVALPTYVAAWYGLRRSLARLPEFERGWLEEFLVSATLPPQERVDLDPNSAGWPFGPLSPKKQVFKLPAFDGVCVSLLAGWLFFCGMMLSRLDTDDPPKLDAAGRFVLMFFLSLAPLGRLLVFCKAGLPPISFAGRVATGRLVIPSYDRALLAPLASLLVTWCGLSVLGRLGLPPILEFPIIATLSFLAALVPGPNLREWALTSEWRIVPIRPQDRGNARAPLRSS